jgi:hypothetical protein
MNRRPKKASPGSTETRGHPEAERVEQPDKVGTLQKLISENLRSVVVAIVTAGIGAFGFWLSPLRDLVAHKIWHEKAVILLTTDYTSVPEGSPLQLRVVVTPQSTVHIDKGVVTVTFDRQLLRLNAAESTFASPIIDAPTVLPDGKAIEFLALAPGKTAIQVELQTRYGHYSAESTVSIDQAQISDKATRENFTGSWILRLGTSSGKMDIRQQGHTTVTGHYFLDNGDKGVIDAGRDGDKFWGSFTRGSSITRWVIEKADISTDEGYLELKGSAYLQRASQDGWTRGGTDIEFYATVPMR